MATTKYGNLILLCITGKFNQVAWIDKYLEICFSVSGGELVSRSGNRNVLVNSTGKVRWTPSVKVSALCDFNLRYWPFDTQKCFLKLASWVYSDDEINITTPSINDYSSEEVKIYKIHTIKEVKMLLIYYVF